MKVRPDEWIDEWGACKTCGGEIPYGHTPGCDFWQLEQRVSFLSNLCIRAVVEGWTETEVMAEMTRWTPAK